MIPPPATPSCRSAAKDHARPIHNNLCGGLVAAIAFKLAWLYWLLAAALGAVLLKLRGNG